MGPKRDLTAADLDLYDTPKEAKRIKQYHNNWQLWLVLVDCAHHIISRKKHSDCADMSKHTSTRFTEAVIRAKGMHGKAYYEVSLFVGNIELLAVGGLHGHEARPNKNPFLGSSIPNLPIALQKESRSSSIYVKEDTAMSTFSNRHLRKYGKIAAAYKWSGHSDRFVSSGFYPVNPLQFTDHIVAHKGISVVTQLASFFLTCLATKSATQEDWTRMLSIACTDVSINKLIKNKSRITFRVIQRSISQGSRISQFIQVVISGLALLEPRVGSGEAGMLPILQQMKDICIKVMGTAYAAKIRTANASAVRSYSQNHLSPIPFN